MSAAEKLKALGAGFDRVTPIMRKTGPKMLGADAYVHAKDIHAYVNALPQIVAVVKAAETHVRPDVWISGEPYHGEPIFPDIASGTTASEWLRVALSALDSALSDDLGDVT